MEYFPYRGDQLFADGDGIGTHTVEEDRLAGPQHRQAECVHAANRQLASLQLGHELLKTKFGMGWSSTQDDHNASEVENFQPTRQARNPERTPFRKKATR